MSHQAQEELSTIGRIMAHLAHKGHHLSTPSQMSIPFLQHKHFLKPILQLCASRNAI